MKKIVLLLAAAAMVCATAMGQGQEPKKKGGFWNKVKKGIESTTGLDVSDEALFVYPNPGEWKMKLISATGNPEDNTVVVKFGIMPVSAKDVGVFIELVNVISGGGENLPEGSSWKEQRKFLTHNLDESPLYQAKLTSGNFSEFTLQPIRVPDGTKSFKSIGFTVISGHEEEKGYEIRSIPIDWKQAQVENN